MLALWFSALAVLAPCALADPSLLYELNTLSPYIKFTDGAEPWRVYRRASGHYMTVPEVPVEQDTWFGQIQQWWWKANTTGASFSVNTTGSALYVRGYLNTTLSHERVLSSDVISLSINGAPVAMNSTTADGYKPLVYIRDVNWLEIPSQPGAHEYTVTLGPAWEGEIAVGFMHSRIHQPALE